MCKGACLTKNVGPVKKGVDIQLRHRIWISCMPDYIIKVSVRTVFPFPVWLCLCRAVYNCLCARHLAFISKCKYTCRKSDIM